MNNNKLRVELLGRTFIWKDMGTINDLANATSVVRDLQHNQGYMIACIEEIAFNNQWIDSECLNKIAHDYKNTIYGEYLNTLVQN